MGEVLGGVLAVAGLLALCALPIVLSVWRRPVEAMVSQGSAAGQTGLAIHPARGHRWMPAIGGVITVAVLALGVFYLGSYPYAAAVFLTAGGYFVYLVWARATGRAGDGTLTMTPDGIHQLWAASEVFIPWEDVRGLATTPKELIVETHRAPRTRRTLPLLGGRRAVNQPDAIALPSRHLPLMPYQQMIELYATDPAARAELATDEPVTRARQIIHDVLDNPPQQDR